VKCRSRPSTPSRSGRIRMCLSSPAMARPGAGHLQVIPMSGRASKRSGKLYADRVYASRAHCAWLRRQDIAARIARYGVESRERLGRWHWAVERESCSSPRFLRAEVSVTVESAVAEPPGDKPDNAHTREFGKVSFSSSRTRVSVRKFRRKLPENRRLLRLAVPS
jgi:hypothetical protein